MHTRWVFFTLALRAAVICAAQLFCCVYSGQSKRARIHGTHGGLMREHQTRDNCARDERIIQSVCVYETHEFTV